MNIKTDFDMFMKPLSDEIALERGIEFFYEVVFYAVIIMICSYEIAVGYQKGLDKKEDDKLVIKKLEDMLIMEEARIVDIEQNYAEKFGQLKESINQINLKMDAIVQQSRSNILLDREMQLMLGRLNDKFLAVEQATESLS